MDAFVVAENPTAEAGGVRSDHGCFGCGDLNPHGLHLRFAPIDDHGVRADFTPQPVHEGFAGVVHGGIVSALLDEAMAWSTYRLQAWSVTAQISVRFRRPVEVGVPVRVVARVVADRGRRLDTHGEVRRADDDALLAEADAVFLRVPEAQAAAWRERYLGVAAAAEG